MNRIKSAKKQTIDGILFLQGVFKKDCKHVEEFFHERLLHESVRETKLYDKIPLVFTGLDTWPKSTNLLCWNCNRGFKTRPWFEPQSIDPLSRGTAGVLLTGDEIKNNHNIDACRIAVRGNFCSPHCVVKHIITYSKNLAERLNKINMLLYVHTIFTGIVALTIFSAPERFDMEQYGGSMSQQEYQKKLDELSAYFLKQDEAIFANNCKLYANRLELE